MSIAEIRNTIKGKITDVTRLQPAEIEDDASLKDDLGLDSLTLMEIALSVDQAYEADFSEEELMQMTSVTVAADMVHERLVASA